MEYNKLATKEAVERTSKALGERNIEVHYVETGADALAKLKELIPAGASVMNGSSRTLEEIGLVEHLKSGAHGWNNLHENILKETDKEKQKVLRRQSVLSDYYMGSVHALAETGEFLIASNTGSQLPHIVYTSPNLIFVVSTKKIVPNLDACMKRLYEHVIPLEEENMRQKYGVGTWPSKVLLFQRESPTSGRKVRMILVNEDLGF